MKKLNKLAVVVFAVAVMLLCRQNVFAWEHKEVKVSTTYSTNDAYYTDAQAGSGGAFNVIVSSITLKFTGNNAHFRYNKSTDTYSGGGGAIANYTGSTVEIANGAEFSHNQGDLGGAIYNATSSTFTIGSGASFSYNQGGRNGGAIWNNGTFTIGSGASFNQNTTELQGGAIYNRDKKGTLTIEDGAVFSNNTATRQGGVIYNAGKITIGNNAKFTGNKSSGDAGQGEGGAIYNFNGGKISIGSDAVFEDNFSKKSYGGAIFNSTYGTINIGSNALFKNNSSKEIFGGAIYNAEIGTITIQDGAKFIGNTSKQEGGAIYNLGTLNLTAKTNNVEFTGNKHCVGTANEESNAIYAYHDSVINLYAEGANIVFNDKIKSMNNTSKLYINMFSDDRTADGKVILNEDMSKFTGTTTIQRGTVELGENGKWFGGDVIVNALGNTTINLANNVIETINFKSISVGSTKNFNLIVDADLEKEKMDKITSTEGLVGDGKITVSKVKIKKDNNANETTVVFFTDSLKDKVEFSGKVVSLLYKYDATYDKATGNFTFVNTGDSSDGGDDDDDGGSGGGGVTPMINMATAAGAVAASVGGYATQSAVINQAFAGIDRQMAQKVQPKTVAPKAPVKPSQESSVTPTDKKQPVKTNGKQNKKSANINSSNLYVSAGNQIFDDSTTIERSLWLRPFALQETIKLNGVDIDNTLYGTLAGIDLPIGQDKQLSFYLGYAGSKQEFDEVKTNQTGYLVGVTGMLVKEKWYLGVTVNGIFNKVSADSEDETNDFDMNMFTVGAKAGYNIDLSDKWILEPNITVMYGIANSDSYQTSLGSIDSQSTSNILVEPQVKAKWQLTNGWQPYGLVGYSANLSSKPKVKAGGEELELDSIDGFVEYGIGVNKEFIGSVWSCYGQVTGRSGGRNGFGGNLGIKYKF